MEVAVNKLLPFLQHSTLAVVLCVAGCADMVTYSYDAQHQGMKLYNQGDYADAAGAFRNSVRQMSTNYESEYYLGACYVQLGQYQQAIAAFKTARQTSKMTLQGQEDEQFHNKIIDGLAMAIAMSDLRDAEINAAQQDAQTHGGAESWYLLGKIYAYRGDADSAIDAYNRATLLEPNNFYIAKDYGLFLERVGQGSRAEAPLRKAYSLDNTDQQVAEALNRIGVVPGPSLLDQNQLAKPLLPKGPIPELQLPSLTKNSQPSQAVQATAEAPRD
jgi:cytochrome c-type biogenesis protein CcmH/NrfG